MESINDIAIQVENLSKRYRIGRNTQGTLRDTIGNLFNKKNATKEFWALKDLSFKINRGESVGIIGKNGAGKSTLLKLLSKITYPTEGKIEFTGRVSSLLEVGTGFHPELTGRENIYLNGSLLGMKNSEINQKLDEIIDFSGVEQFIDTPIKRYSSGMYVRLAFSVAAHMNTDILLVDEVLAVGDAEFQSKCLGKMKELGNGGRTVLFVSHDEAAIRKLTSRVILLNEGQVEFIGSTDEAFQIYNKSIVLKNKKIYTNQEALRSIEATYTDHLVVDVEYKFENRPLLPHLGVVIKNDKGQIVFGTNPTLEKIKINKEFLENGKVRVSFYSPKLRYGNYTVSVWLSSGEKDVFQDEDAIGFAVGNKGNKGNFGFIVPDCKYEFYD